MTHSDFLGLRQLSDFLKKQDISKASSVSISPILKGQ